MPIDCANRLLGRRQSAILLRFPLARNLGNRVTFTAVLCAHAEDNKRTTIYVRKKSFQRRFSQRKRLHAPAIKFIGALLVFSLYLVQPAAADEGVHVAVRGADAGLEHPQGVNRQL